MCVHTKNPIWFLNFNNNDIIKSEKMCVHTKKPIMMISRDKYLNQLIKAKNNGFAKVVTGIRRCGKSYLLNTIFKEHLLKSGVKNQNIIFIDLTQISNSNFRDPLNLYNHILELTSLNEGISYVIIDEIQEVFPLINLSLTDGKHIKANSNDEEVITFVDVILDLASKDNIDLYVTGSNSKLLSTDIITEFRDRATNINLRPVSYSEFCEFKGSINENILNEYLIYGGMPLAIFKESVEKENYLKGLFETTYIRDIIENNRIRKKEALDEISIFLSTCVGDLINSSKLAKLYEAKHGKKIDEDTINSYINYFLDSFILEKAFRYDLKGKRIIGSTKKYYYTDLGLRNSRVNFVYEDKGKLLENLIYNELIYNDYKVNVGTFDVFSKDENNKTTRQSLEIDFLAIKNRRMYYIQVCDNYSSKSTIQREIKPYIALNDQITKIIVVNDSIGEFRDEHGFTIIGINDFLLRYIK